MISDYEDKVKLGQNPSFDQNIFQYVFIKKLRDLSVMSFKINEYIAENVLAYNPIPGNYKGCVDLEKQLAERLGLYNVLKYSEIALASS